MCKRWERLVSFKLPELNYQIWWAVRLLPCLHFTCVSCFFVLHSFKTKLYLNVWLLFVVLVSIWFSKTLELKNEWITAKYLSVWGQYQSSGPWTTPVPLGPKQYWPCVLGFCLVGNADRLLFFIFISNSYKISLMEAAQITVSFEMGDCFGQWCKM